MAMILSGGGARGAYEVGVLWYVFDDLTRLRGGPPRIDILCGTSVGAINACYLAAHLADPVLGLRRLVEFVGGARAAHGARLRAEPDRLDAARARSAAEGSGAGLFDVTPMADLVQREISLARRARVPPTATAPRAHRLDHRGRHGAHGRLHANVARPGDPGAAPRRARSSAPITSAPSTRSPAPPSRFCSHRSRSTTSCTSTAVCGRTRRSRPPCASARRTSSRWGARAR